MTYSPQGGYPSQPDPYGQPQPGGYPQQPAGYQSPGGGYPSQPDPYGWGQQQQPGYPQQPQQFPAPQPPKKSNGGLIAGLVIGGLVLVLGVVLAVVLINRDDGGSSAGDNSGGTSADGGDSDSGSEDGVPSQSPTEVVNAYYQANEDRDWEEALSYLSKKLQNEYGGVSDADRDAAADQLEGAVYTVLEETIASDGQTADVTINMDFQGASQGATLKMIIEDGGWKIDEFTV